MNNQTKLKTHGQMKALYPSRLVLYVGEEGEEGSGRQVIY